MAERRSEHDEQLSNEQFEALKARTTSLGRDALNNLYWYFGGHKLYTESSSGSESQQHLSEGMSEEEGNWDVSCQTLKQWEGLLRKLKRSSTDEEKKLAAVVQDEVFPKAKALLEKMASAQVEEEVETLPKRRPAKKKSKPKPPKLDSGEDDKKPSVKKPKKEKPTPTRKPEVDDDDAASIDDDLTSPDNSKKSMTKRKPPEKETKDERGGTVSTKKNQLSLSIDNCDASAKRDKTDDDDETFEPEERPLEIAEDNQTEGKRPSGRRAARNCMKRQREVLQLTEEPSSEEDELPSNRKRSRRDSDDDDFSEEHGRKKKKSAMKRRPSSDKPMTPYMPKTFAKPQVEERKIFMFSTSLANVAAEAVERLLVPSIIAYHSQHPSSTGYLCDSMPNARHFVRRQEPHPGPFMHDPMSGYSRPPIAPPTWFASKPPAIHSAASTWQPPPFGSTTDHNDGTRERLHAPASQIQYHHPMQSGHHHHHHHPFSQNPAGGYPPSHPMYPGFSGHIPPGISPPQQTGHPTQPSFSDYSVEDLTQILVGGSTGAAGTTRQRPATYAQTDFYRGQVYDQHPQMGGQPEQGGSSFSMQNPSYAYHPGHPGYPTRVPDVHSSMGREYFSSHAGMSRGAHDLGMYQGTVRDMSADYHQHWGMHHPVAVPHQASQQHEAIPRHEMYTDQQRQQQQQQQQQHLGYSHMTSSGMQPSNWPPPPPYPLHQQPQEGETSGTPHDASYQSRPRSSSNPPPRGTPTTPNAPHDTHHNWPATRPVVTGSMLSHQMMPQQQTDPHQEAGGRASARSSASGYSQADATGASTLIEMSSGVNKQGGTTAVAHPIGRFRGFPSEHSHIMGGSQDSKYLHPPPALATIGPKSDPLSVLASLTDKQSPLPPTSVLQSQEKGDDVKGGGEGESNGNIGGNKRASSFSIENLAAPHRKDGGVGIEPRMTTAAFPVTTATPQASFVGTLAPSPFPNFNSVSHPGYTQSHPGWSGNPGFQHPGHKVFHSYPGMSEMNHRASAGILASESQGESSQKDS